MAGVWECRCEYWRGHLWRVFGALVSVHDPAAGCWRLVRTKRKKGNCFRFEDEESGEKNRCTSLPNCPVVSSTPKNANMSRDILDTPVKDRIESFLFHLKVRNLPSAGGKPVQNPPITELTLPLNPFFHPPPTTLCGTILPSHLSPPSPLPPTLSSLSPPHACLLLGLRLFP